jgi:hypothetical protein
MKSKYEIVPGANPWAVFPLDSMLDVLDNWVI